MRDTAVGRDHALAATGRVRPKSRSGWTRLGIAALAVGSGILGWSWSHGTSSAVSRGGAAYERGDWIQASRLAQERLALAQDDPQALRLLARSTARLGRHPAAQSIYAGLDPQALEAEDHFLLALGRSRAGEAVAARQVLNRALAVDPDHADALDLFAKVALQTGRVSEAARAAERLARRPGWEARGELLLGVIRATDHNPAGAVESFRRALRRDPTVRVVPADRFSTHRLLARSLLQTGRPGEARDTLLTVLDAGPDREASWLLSRAYLQEEDGVQAAAALARSGTYRAEHPLEPEPAPYVGAARCAGCHPDVQQAVLASRHARTLQHGRELADLPLPDHPLADPGNPQVSHILERVDGQVHFETHLPNRVLRAVVDYALGSSDRYTSLVGRDERGRARTLRLSYYRGAGGSGWDRSKAQAEHPQREEDFLGEAFGSIAEAHECLICHTTNARAVRDRTGPEAGDRAIGCERCHGPGGLHLAAVATQFSVPAIASPAQASPAAVNQLCGDCHSQHFLAMPAARTAPDWTRFPGSTLPWSRCYAESGGVLSCVTCHDPHTNAAIAPASYEAKCLSCHATSAAPAPAASGRPHQPETAFRSPCPVNPTHDCLPCHMPKVRYDWLHGWFTDHYIRVHRPNDSAAQGLPARGSTIAGWPSRSSQG